MIAEIVSLAINSSRSNGWPVKLANGGISTFKACGKVFHEMGHLFMCFVNEIEVKEYKLLDITENWEIKGYVKTKQHFNFPAQLGILLGPILLNSLLILTFYFLSYFFLEAGIQALFILLIIMSLFGSLPSLKDVKALEKVGSQTQTRYLAGSLLVIGLFSVLFFILLFVPYGYFWIIMGNYLPTMAALYIIGRRSKPKPGIRFEKDDEERELQKEDKEPDDFVRWLRNE